LKGLSFCNTLVITPVMIAMTTRRKLENKMVILQENILSRIR